MRRFPGNDLLIAHDPRGGTLTLSAKDRSMHMYVVGATGVGKSKFLEHIVRQDIRNWRKSKCGLLLLDPHGAVYDGVRQWITRMSFVYNRPIIPIDLRRDDWVVAYNLLRERKAAASVITANMVDALAYVWVYGGRKPGRPPSFKPSKVKERVGDSLLIEGLYQRLQPV